VALDFTVEESEDLITWTLVEESRVSKTLSLPEGKRSTASLIEPKERRVTPPLVSLSKALQPPPRMPVEDEATKKSARLRTRFPALWKNPFNTSGPR